MKRTIVLSLLLVSLTAAPAVAEIKEIELKDGSVISGEVQSLSNGVYTVRTESLGTVQLNEAKVKSIRPLGSSSGQQKPDQSSQVQGLEEKMRNDKEVMGMIETLKDDAQFRQILEDPELMRAVQSNDVAALMSNPKFLQLMQNPTVKNIQQKVSK